MQPIEPNSQISKYFQELSLDYAKKYKHSGIKEHAIKILKYFTKVNLQNFTVLEIGCGIGGLLFEFLKMNSKYIIGFDLSENMTSTAHKIAEELDYCDKTAFLTDDFNSYDVSKLNNALLPSPDIIIADRVFCCSPYSKQILEKIISIHPTYIVLVLPRRNILYRKLWRAKSKIRNMKLKIDSNIPIYYYLESEISSVCLKHQYSIDFHSYRYVWETIIYKKR